MNQQELREYINKIVNRTKTSYKNKYGGDLALTSAMVMAAWKRDDASYMVKPKFTRRDPQYGYSESNICFVEGAVKGWNWDYFGSADNEQVKR